MKQDPGAQVLLAADGPFMRKLPASLLADAGHVVKAASDERESETLEELRRVAARAGSVPALARPSNRPGGRRPS
jgi:CheY-like chemotaxis protein